MRLITSIRPLFEVKVLHHYFLNDANNVFDAMPLSEKKRVLRGYDVRSFISIEPTIACASVMARHRLIYKDTAVGFIVGVPITRSANKFFPAFPLDDDLRFTFSARFSDPYFYNYTALPLIKDESACFYLQNQTINSKKRFPYLTQFPAAFDGGTYSSGDILCNNLLNPTQLFVANKLTTTGPPGSDWTNDTLVDGNPLQYVTKKDRLSVYTDFIRYNTGETELNNLSLTLKNRRGDVLPVKFEIVTENEKQVALIDIHLLPENFYTIRLLDPDISFDKEFSFFRLSYYSGPDMLIDLSVKSDVNSYNMIEADGSIASAGAGVVYQLRFRNRHTIWRYLGEKFIVNQPEKGPHPLTKRGFIHVSVEDDSHNMIDDLPNPTIRMIKAEHPVDDNKHYNVFSEIFIH